MSDAVRTRIAPSPTGLPHVGTIRNALYSWLLARRHNGQFIFRLEDTDRERYDPRSEAALFEAFRWLELDYDEGPDRGGPYGPYVQSQRLPVYRAAVEMLLESGTAYHCYCSRERVQQVREARRAAGLHPYGYDRRCRELGEAERRRLAADCLHPVIRFAVPLDGETVFEDAVRGRIAFQNRELDDHILLKADGFPTYHLASVVDDHHMAITHVIRSEEWISSTPRHQLQYEAFGWTPPVFAHPALIHGRDPATGKVSKLSKRHGAVHVGEYREQGYLPEALCNFIALLGWSPGGDRELMSRSEMAALFSLEGLNPAPSVFDRDKLDWMNGAYIRALPAEELLARTAPFLRAAGLPVAEEEGGDPEYVTRVLRLEQERLKTLAEAPELTAFFFRDPPEYQEAAVERWLRAARSREILEDVAARLAAAEPWEAAQIEAAVRAAINGLQVKPGEVIHRVRVATTGRTVGPGLFDTLEVLGRERVMGRVRHAITHYCE